MLDNGMLWACAAYLNMSILWEDVLENLRNATPCFIVVAHSSRDWASTRSPALFAHRRRPAPARGSSVQPLRRRPKFSPRKLKRGIAEYTMIGPVVPFDPLYGRSHSQLVGTLPSLDHSRVIIPHANCTQHATYTKLACCGFGVQNLREVPCRL